MRSFLKFFLASFVALIVFSLLSFFFMLMLMARLGAGARAKVAVGPNAVLVVDLSRPLPEMHTDNFFSSFDAGGAADLPGLFEASSLIRNAATDDRVKGIYIKADANANGFAGSEEIRRAVAAFRKSGKFVYAYAENMSQNAYYIASTANKVYVHPKGGIDFTGYSMTLMYFKGLLEKLDIEPQIFYNGKFKSATEPLREYKMSDANRIQTTSFLGELYGDYLSKVGEARKLDTATLHRYANEGLIFQPTDAEQYKLIDGLRYDDQVMDEIKRSLAIGGDEQVNFVSLNRYAASERGMESYSGNIALIYAQGEIHSGEVSENTIAGDDYVKMIREARQDKDIRAIVFRVNSPGGSALASESIWRELTLARKSKPVVVSMGDYAASGGYYISCMADSIFAEPQTLTGSIGVFTVLPNMEGFFNKKLGITFDGVKTGQYADAGTSTRPLTEKEKAFVQRAIDTIYDTFKQRVVAGRKLSAGVVDSISQGRVWTGRQAQKLGLVDRLGGLQDAIDCAARMANVPEVDVTVFPRQKDPFERMVRNFSQQMKADMVKEELGADYRIFETIKKLRAMQGEAQARLPFEMVID